MILILHVRLLSVQSCCAIKPPNGVYDPKFSADLVKRLGIALRKSFSFTSALETNMFSCNPITLARTVNDKEK